MPDLLGSSLACDGLYYANGQHVDGALPPIADGNVLTETYTQQKALRPEARAYQHNGNNLGLVYMVPLWWRPYMDVPPAVLAALVMAADKGEGIIIHAENDLVALGVELEIKAWHWLRGPKSIC